jgi:hypothetical protein
LFDHGIDSLIIEMVKCLSPPSFALSLYTPPEEFMGLSNEKRKKCRGKCPVEL